MEFNKFQISTKNSFAYNLLQNSPFKMFQTYFQTNHHTHQIDAVWLCYLLLSKPFINSKYLILLFSISRSKIRENVCVVTKAILFKAGTGTCCLESRIQWIELLTQLFHWCTYAIVFVLIRFVNKCHANVVSNTIKLYNKENSIFNVSAVSLANIMLIWNVHALAKYSSVRWFFFFENTN